MRTKIILLPFLFICLLACKATFVPPYDASIEAQISKTARLTDALYLQMLDDKESDRKYEKYADKYLDIQVEINSLLLKTQVRLYNKEMLVMVQNLQKLFIQFKEDHKTKMLLKDVDIQLNMMQVNAVWAPLLLAERALKRQK